jgi:hypothetical protein
MPFEFLPIFEQFYLMNKAKLVIAQRSFSKYNIYETKHASSRNNGYSTI